MFGALEAMNMIPYCQNQQHIGPHFTPEARNTGELGKSHTMAQSTEQTLVAPTKRKRSLMEKLPGLGLQGEPSVKN